MTERDDTPTGAWPETVQHQGPETDGDPQATQDEGAPSLAGFSFLRELGAGGFGSVWLARHLALDRLVAVKHLPGWSGAGQRAAEHEARVMASLKVHPNRVTVFDLIGTDEGWFLVLDYVAGGSLMRRVAAEGPLNWAPAARYVAGVAEGLAEVHARGILHRDIKPANILLDPERDEALLTDFGLAAQATTATTAGGTLGYMAPEVFEAAPGAASDVFALAATLFHLVTGQPPFDHRDFLKSFDQARQGLPRSSTALEHLPLTAGELIVAALDPDPAKRPSLAEFVARMRTAHLDAVARRLQGQAGQAARVAVTASTADARDLVFRPVPLAASSEHLDRSGPALPLHTGDLVRLEVSADAEGYLTVLNLGSSGEVHVLVPSARAPDNRIRAGRPHRLTVRLALPGGTDRLVALWTRHQWQFTPAQWREQIEGGMPALAAADSRRDLEVVLHETATAPGHWAAAVIELPHQP
jgi:serine/threonine protein kinase